MQHKQKEMKRLAGILATKQKENEASAANGAWRKHTEIERGNPVRTYEGEKFRRR